MDYLDYEGLQRYHELLYNDINDIKDTIEENEEITASALNNLNNKFGELGNAVEAVEAIYYTQEEADTYNTEHSLNSGDEEYVTTETIKTPAVEEVPHTVKSYVDDKFLSKCINTTYNELKGWRDNSQLVPGQWYRITDYVTTTVQDDTRSAGHQFDVIVMALSENTLSEEAYADYHEGDTYFHNTSNNRKYYAELNKWQLKYCLDNDKDRFAWPMQDESNVKINGVRKYRYMAGDVEGATYPYAWGTSASKVFTASETPAANDTAYAASDGTGDTFTIEEFSGGGKGVIYWLKDEWGNECPYDFKNIQFKRYRTKYSTIITPISNYNNIFSKILIAGVLGTLYYNNTDTWGDASGRAIALNIHQGEGVVNGDTLTGDYVNYEGSIITVDTTAKYKKVTEGMYATIYGEGWLYTFSTGVSSESKFDNSEAEDSTRIISGYFIGNKIKNNYASKTNTKRLKLNNIVFINTSSAKSKFNTFEEDCFDITLGAYTTCNKFGKRCHNITIEHGYSFNDSSSSNPNGYNSFGDECYNILLGTYSYNNKFGYANHDIYSSRHLTNTNIGDDSFCITAVEGIDRCAFENYCRNIVIRRRCDNTSFANNVFNIASFELNNCSIENNVHDIIASRVDDPGYNDLIGFIYDSIVENTVNYIKLKINLTTSAGMPARNIKICQGVSGTASEPKEIDVDVVGQDYQIEYKNANSQIIEV